MGLRDRGPDISKEARLFIESLEAIDDLPNSLGLDGVDFRHTGDMLQGKYADVFWLEYDGKDVAIKRLRNFVTHQDRRVFQKVVHNNYHCIAF
jgi:hypothetical protein